VETPSSHDGGSQLKSTGRATAGRPEVQKKGTAGSMSQEELGKKQDVFETKKGLQKE
jgi:hypothetical protein